MAIRSSLVLGFALLVCVLALLSEPTIAGFNPSEFPNGFYYGSSTASYQTEGMTNKSGRGPSVWDVFTHDHPERIADGSNGDIAIDMYHRYAEDMKRMKEAGLNAFRFSLSWSRMIPHGQIRSGVNEEGISFYNRLINEALANGLEPFVTIFHWDAPQALEDKYGGFRSPDIIADFRDYAQLCFERFGDRVKYWITLNEPSAFASWGYDTGEFAPGRCSPWVNRLCPAGDSATEPYIVTHHLLLSHAAAVKVYREKYKPIQNGKIGFTLVSAWYEPYSNSTHDIDSVKRSFDFHFGWYIDPITYGDYPRSMREYVKDRLPKFTYEQSMLVKGSIDFLGLNYYTAKFSRHVDHVDPERISYTNDPHRILGIQDSQGNYIGPPSGLFWFRVVPYGIRLLLKYVKDNYRNPEIFITENGMSQDNSTSTYEELIHDKVRIEYYDQHLGNISQAIRDYGVNVKGYFAWSFMDNFEWSSGYTKRFGLTYVNYNQNLTRTPKDSMKWLSNHLLPKIEDNKWSRPLGFKSSSM